MMPGYYQGTCHMEVEKYYENKNCRKGNKKKYKIKINQNFIVDFCNIFKRKNSISLT